MQLDLSEIGPRARALAAELEETGRLLAEREAAAQAARDEAEEGFRADARRREERFAAEMEASRARGAEGMSRRDAFREGRVARIGRSATRLKRRLEADLAKESDRTAEELSIVRERLAAEHDRRFSPLKDRLRRWQDLAGQVRDRRVQAEQTVRLFAARHGATEPAVDGWSGAVDVDADPDRMAAEALAALDEARSDTARAAVRLRTSLARTGPFLLYLVLLLVAAAAGAVVAVRVEAGPNALPGIAVGLAAAVVALGIAGRAARRGSARRAARHLSRIRFEAERFDRHAEGALKHLDALHVEQAEAHRKSLREAEGPLLDASRARSEETRRRIGEIDARRERAARRLSERHERWLGSAGAREEARREERRAEHEAARGREEAAHRERLAAIEAERAAAVAELAARREAALADFRRYADGANDAVLRRNPPWDRVDPATLVLPPDFPRFVPFGRIRIPLEGFELPVALTYPDGGSLLVEHGPAGRERALRILTGAVLRALTSFPPGRVRLTILDPVGLGESFSSLMHLADHDEALVHSRIWTETQHIERQLADLTAHIEKVIQKYLRNRYGTIGEYNAEAGDLQEPYQLVVVADFPTGFNDLASERLASIVASGPRCGVYTLIARDIRQEPLPPVDLERLRRNGPALTLTGGAWRLRGEGLEEGEFLPEDVPSPEFAIALLDRVGALSVDADRVELPFSAVIPPAGEIWTGSTRSGVRVPIGRTGAERLQYLDLGRGTAQHALLAGRTGSGKSTLFHVMITNMALWFSPDEVEFYLIDFKKGVEFKPFAAHALPHARVVAIESDREFGLSVLRALDAELARRGDLFRRRGVQDLAAWRREAEGESMPRTLLLVDEFQEFFTEDDAVAHQASLLLDRFVRQGRAFGIHVVLGSQTLSGIYTLARSTLGQMGVRIALQCNEADSYLILSEENGVARLLTRPGEAIYNDKSGLLEGNNPFQVVWLPEEEEEVHLRRVAARAAADPALLARERVVFEGNQPADLEKNAELLSLLRSGPPSVAGDDRVWLGDPNAIKGPTEVRFTPVGGSNLLVVGQRRDAAFAMMAAAVLGLAAQHRPDDLRVAILDGGGHEPDLAALLDALTTCVPHRVDRYDLRSIPDAVAEVAALVKEREEGEGGGPAVYVFAFGLQRLRMLRKEDEFSMSYGEPGAESVGDHFSKILAEGPAQRVHAFVWCYTVANLGKTLGRRGMREFDARVLFQMGAADSSEMIDSSAANNLGLYNALLAIESLGTFEKFRPYAVPTAATLRRLGGIR